MHDQTQEWSKSGAPIAHVLNNEMSMFQASQPGYSHGTSTTPFSGKLVDLLLDTTTEVYTRYKKPEDPPAESTLAVIENPVIQLPKPRQPPKQTAKRPRIPPLLQGLHQPPPLPPAGRLFPPITEGVDTFERDLRGKADVDIVVSEKSGKDDVAKSPDVAKPAAATDEQAAKSVKRKRNIVRKRRKWSDEETRDLLLGVSRFGIGSWKKILHCEDFKFDGRTAVDLKDRFRVCCPDEVSKSRKVVQDEGTREGVGDASGQGSSKENAPLAEPRAAGSAVGDAAVDNTENLLPEKPSKLAKFGIEASFAPNTRRPRRTFSAKDDENLWKGYEKYGAVWHLMRNDEELGFKNRHPTDLRDRFRIRYPETYASAGYKLKPTSKVPHGSDDSHKANGDRLPASAEASSSATNSTNRLRQDKPEPEPRGVEQPTTITHPSTKPPTLMPFPLGTLSWLDDMSPIGSEQEGSNSPVVLNRNILQWADVNSGPTPTPRVNISLYGDGFGDVSYPSTHAVDTGHIDPMATLNLPFIALPSQTPPTSARSKVSPGAASLFNPPPAPSHTSVSAATPALPETSNMPSSSLTVPSKSSSSSSNLLRTPNLPTIVFPHVPVASARNAVHNLPTPADLLSGMDADMAELHVPGSLGENSFGHHGLFGSGHASML